MFFLGPESVAELKRILNEALTKFKEQRNELQGIIIMDTEKHTYEKHSYYNMIIMFILH